MKVYVCHYVDFNYESIIDGVCQNVKSAMSSVEGHLRDVMDYEEFEEFWEKHKDAMQQDLETNRELAINDYYADEDCYQVELVEVW